jgi:putative hydroxymethylpyrimidine transport system permease protein
LKRKSGNTAEAGRGKSPRGKRIPGVDWLPATFLLAVLAIWQGLATFRNVPEFILPSPARVLQELVASWELLMNHAGVTIFEALLGLFSAIVLGAAMGLAMGYFDAFRRMIYPFFVVTQTVPLFVLAPLFILWFGFGLLPKIIVVFLVCFFPIAVTFAQGLTGADGGMEDLLTVMGATRWKIFRITRIPQALPHFFSGLKIAATYSIVGAVIAEWVGAQEGLGIFMTRAMKNFRTGALFADVLIVVALSLILYKAVEMIEKKACRNIGNGV